MVLTAAEEEEKQSGLTIQLAMWVCVLQESVVVPVVYVHIICLLELNSSIAIHIWY